MQSRFAAVASIAVSMTVCVVVAKADNAPTTTCDIAAAFPYDNQRKAQGVPYRALNASLAIAQCTEAISRYPNSGRLYFQLGRALEKGNRIADAIAAYRRAAENGHGGGFNNLGELYRDGKSVVLDLAQAEQYFQKGADLGYAEAQFNLANVLLKKQGNDVDIERARQLLTAASIAGYVDAFAPLRALPPLSPSVGAKASHFPLDQFSPEGVWAIGNLNACSHDFYTLHVVGNTWYFTDSKNRRNVETIIETDGKRYVSETIVSHDVPQGTRWSYEFIDNFRIHVVNITTNRAISSPLVRCAAPTAVAHEQVQNPEAPAQSQAYSEGLADRIAYEQWFATLDDQKKAGAEYWASQRSLPNPGSCTGPTNAESDRRMEAGCHEAQRRLAPTDARRLSEPDYRLGWNAFPEAPQAASQPNSAFLPGAMWTIPGATTAQPPTSPFPATPLVQPAEAIASSRQLPPPAPVAVDPTPHSVSSSEPMPANVSAFKPASMRQCAAGVPPPLSAVPPAKQSSRPAAQAACPSASGLADRFGALQRSAAPAQQVVERETVRVRELQKQMNDIGDRCPEEFRCANIAGLTNLQSLNFASLSQEANDINRCAGVLLRNLIDAPSQPSNIQTLFDQLQHIEEGSMALSGDLAVATRLAERRMSGFDANLRQCRDFTKTP